MPDDRFRPPRPQRAPEWVGPAGTMVDVSELSDRALMLKCYNEVLVMSATLGGFLRSHSVLAGRVSKLERKDTKDEEEITAVRDLRKTVKKFKHWLWLSIGAIVVTLVTGYIMMRLGVRIEVP